MFGEDRAAHDPRTQPVDRDRLPTWRPIWRPPILTVVVWYPNVEPAMPGRRPSRCPAAAGVNCWSIMASQRCPYRTGVWTRRSRFAPNVKAAVTAATDSAVPARAVRTGIAVCPRRGSSAIRTPAAAVTGAPTARLRVAEHRQVTGRVPRASP